MDAIIIFTNWQRIFDLQGYRLSFNPKNTGPKQIKISEKEAFIIVWDEIIDFSSLLVLVENNSNVYILNHTNPILEKLIDLKDLLNQKNCQVKNMTQKQHGFDDEYIKIQEIDACIKTENKYSFYNPNISKLKEVFNWYLERLLPMDKLEAVLEFLHNCLSSKAEILPKEIENDYMCLIDNKEITIEQLYETWKGPKDYDGLANLRDGMLEWALVK